VSFLVADGELVATTGAAGGQYPATVGRAVALAETVFVAALAVGGLERAFHRKVCVKKIVGVSKRAGKGRRKNGVGQDGTEKSFEAAPDTSGTSGSLQFLAHSLPSMGHSLPGHDLN